MVVGLCIFNIKSLSGAVTFRLLQRHIYIAKHKRSIRHKLIERLLADIYLHIPPSTDRSREASGLGVFGRTDDVAGSKLKGIASVIICETRPKNHVHS